MSGTTEQPQQPLGVYKCKQVIHDTFLQNGNNEWFTTLILSKAYEQGWKWTVQEEFIQYIKRKKSMYITVNVSDMISDLAPLGRELFPAELKKELSQTLFDATKYYFTINDTITPITDSDDANSEAEKTFLYQPEPGIGIGVGEIPESPPPTPLTSNSTASTSTTPRRSPGPVSSTSTSPPTTTTRQSPV